MGNFEKLIVLVVLFAAAVVLAVNFTGGDEVQASDPLTGAEEVLGGAPGAMPPGDAHSALLSAGLEPELAFPAPAAGLQPAPGATTAPAGPIEPAASTALAAPDASDPSRPILLDTTGLRPSFLDEYMVYAVQGGDTWTGLAQRFYQDGRFTRNLMQANDDPSELVPGTEILVPVYDVIAADPSRSSDVAAAEPPARTELAADVPAPRAEPGPRAEPAPGPKPKATAAAPAGVYVVQPGDTLSDIALAAFGSASRWKEILAANQDQLAKPESLRAGMKLTIPAGGKVPAASTVAQGERKGEPAKATSADTATKKKKVL